MPEPELAGGQEEEEEEEGDRQEEAGDHQEVEDHREEEKEEDHHHHAEVEDHAGNRAEDRAEGVGIPIRLVAVDQGIQGGQRDQRDPKVTKQA